MSDHILSWEGKNILASSVDRPPKETRISCTRAAAQNELSQNRKHHSQLSDTHTLKQISPSAFTVLWIYIIQCSIYLHCSKSHYVHHTASLKILVFTFSPAYFGMHEYNWVLMCLSFKLSGFFYGAKVTLSSEILVL